MLSCVVICSYGPPSVGEALDQDTPPPQTEWLIARPRGLFPDKTFLQCESHKLKTCVSVSSLPRWRTERAWRPRRLEVAASSTAVRAATCRATRRTTGLCRIRRYPAPKCRAAAAARVGVRASATKWRRWSVCPRRARARRSCQGKVRGREGRATAALTPYPPRGSSNSRAKTLSILPPLRVRWLLTRKRSQVGLHKCFHMPKWRVGPMTCRVLIALWRDPLIGVLGPLTWHHQRAWHPMEVLIEAEEGPLTGDPVQWKGTAEAWTGRKDPQTGQADPLTGLMGQWTDQGCR